MGSPLVLNTRHMIWYFSLDFLAISEARGVFLCYKHKRGIDTLDIFIRSCNLITNELRDESVFCWAFASFD